MKVKIKSKRFVLKGIRQGNYSCISPEMPKMHCGKIAEVVDEHPYSYGVKFDDEEFDATWYWPKWCCKIIRGERMSNGKIKHLMSCGHVAQAIDGAGNPVCAICLFDIKLHIIERTSENMTDGLEGRKAKCAWCNKKTDSRWDLAFFEYKPDKEYDEYYCGCGGWD